MVKNLDKHFQKQQKNQINKTKRSFKKSSIENSSSNFPIVAIGASAGGLVAFEKFFSGMPKDADPNFAIVLIQHLSPDHKSTLCNLIQRCTKMKVLEVEDGMKIQINCVYIIPPNFYMIITKGILHLVEPLQDRFQRLPIDFFFSSMANDLHERAIGVIFSGTGSDGTLGMLSIKREGGMVIAQTIESSEFNGMPKSAIATGLTDYILSPELIPTQLMTYLANPFSKILAGNLVADPITENARKKIFDLVLEQTGHDFSQYKLSTIYRRIERRMNELQIKEINSYVNLLQDNPKEVILLFREFLIGVTGFFRDPDTFIFFKEQIIPKLFEDKDLSRPIRIWSVGCSTGEEVYSLAMHLVEYAELKKQKNKIQIFATDIDDRAINFARAGLYLANIAVDMPTNFLERYFSAEPDGLSYRIQKNIRDMIVFSIHNVIKDPPFSKLDLIICRNLLIYINTDLQKKLIPLFSYALNSKGMLFLGTSEGVGEFSELFMTLSRSNKIYQRKENQLAIKPAIIGKFFNPSPLPSHPHVPTYRIKKTDPPSKKPLRELVEKLLLQQGPSGVMVNAQGDILYIHGRTGMFLEPASGEIGINNILKMAREGLRTSLAITLTKAVATNKLVKYPGLLKVKTNGHFSFIKLAIHPLLTSQAIQINQIPLFLVMMEEATTIEVPNISLGDDPDLLNKNFPEDCPDNAKMIEPEKKIASSIALLNSLPTLSSSEEMVAILKRELQAKEIYLQSIQEELEKFTDELKDSYEDMQTVNEELQSSNEELETSKEELQSVNEELSTVNNELQTKVVDLMQLNNDMNNLLAGTGIATIFVDHHLRILRFTPTASTINKLLASDVGRDVGHLAFNLVSYEHLVPDVQSVLDTLIPKELEVQTRDHKWYKMRIQPYRTLENMIEGAVICFFDNNEVVKMREELKKGISIK